MDKLPETGKQLRKFGTDSTGPQSVSCAVARMVLFASFCLFCMCMGCACCVHKQVCVRVLVCGDLRLTSGHSVTLQLVTAAGSPGEPSLLQRSAVSAFQPPSSGITGGLPQPPGPRLCSKYVILAASPCLSLPLPNTSCYRELRMHQLLRNLKFLKTEEGNHENIAGCLCAGDFAAGRVQQPSF